MTINSIRAFLAALAALSAVSAATAQGPSPALSEEERDEQTNGAIGYVPMRSDYKNGGYGVWNSPLAQGSAEMLIEAASDLLEAASGR